MVSPILKWAGGKRWFVDRIKPMWKYSGADRLVEPFCGGMAITLGILPQRVLLNDINSHLINFYIWVKKGLLFSIEMNNDKELYYEHRTEFNKLISNGGANSKTAAEYFYFLNKTCYNGLSRFNLRGEFNVPFGKYNSINYADDLLVYKQTLSKWHFSSRAFQCLEVEDTDFIFADPPYDISFTKYSKYSFGWQEQELLIEWLEKHKGPVIITNHATERILKLYKFHNYKTYIIEGPRRISANGNRQPASVVVAIKNLIADDKEVSQFLSLI